MPLLSAAAAGNVRNILKATVQSQRSAILMPKFGTTRLLDCRSLAASAGAPYSSSRAERGFGARPRGGLAGELGGRTVDRYAGGQGLHRLA